MDEKIIQIQMEIFVGIYLHTYKTTKRGDELVLGLYEFKKILVDLLIYELSKGCVFNFWCYSSS